MAVVRIRLLGNRKEAAVLQVRREVAQLLEPVRTRPRASEYLPLFPPLND
jgi:hypothetical protein